MSAQEVHVPDIGDFKGVEIIEVHIKEGDQVNAEDPLITLESDKASMEVPAPHAGTVTEMKVKEGDKISEGDVICMMEAGEDEPKVEPPSPEGHQESDTHAIEHREEPKPDRQAGAETARPGDTTTADGDWSKVHGSPSVRRLARELEIDLAQVKGTGQKGRITKDDVRGFLSQGAAPAAAAQPVAGGAGIPEIPAQDFSKFGPIEKKPLSRIKRISGPHLHRAWLNVPAVTHGDESDITETDAYRKELDAAARDEGYRVTLLSFLMKASVSALKRYPEVNSSLAPEKDALIYKRYYHIGVAVDTPEGLVVPAIKDVDKKGIEELSRELGETSKKAREGKLQSSDLQGASFTISSLGGIGGTDFSPIVNAPEVAILGVVRAKMAPVWNGSEFTPRLMLPVYLSYDHRVVDGALAARFTRHLCHVLEDVRRLVM